MCDNNNIGGHFALTGVKFLPGPKNYCHVLKKVLTSQCFLSVRLHAELRLRDFTRKLCTKLIAVHVFFFPGPNKVAFLITNFNRYKQAVDNELVSAELKSRLYQQESLCPYLDGDQVLSWVGQPSNVHLTRLIELAGAENNPKSIVNQACAIL